MRRYWKTFLLRGMMFGGFGPIIMGIVYWSLSLSLPQFSLGGGEVLLAILSTYLLAFLQAGASVFNQIEEWPIAKSLLFHFFTLYVAYVGCYLINTWLPFEWTVILIFTAVFAVVYLIIWFTVWLSVRHISRRFNQVLK